MRSTVCLLLFLTLPIASRAADADFGSAANIGMGGAYSAMPADAATIWFNPALGSLSRTFLRASLATRNCYQLSALEEKTGSLVFGLGNRTSVGGGFSQFGQSGLYSESNALLTAAMEVRKNWALGAGVHYLRVEFGDNTKAYAGVSLDLGLASRVLPQTLVSAAVRRISIERLYESNNAPAILEASAAWEGPSITLASIWSKPFGERSRFGIGQSLQVAKDLPLDAGLVFLSGLRFDPVRYTLGARILAGGGSLDYVYQSHPDLGGTHVLGITFQLNKR